MKTANNRISGKIAFQTDRDKKDSIYSISREGMEYLCDGRMPSFSKDGKKIVFVNAQKVTNRAYGDNKLFIMDLPTKRVKEINTKGLKITQYASPVFDPRSEKVAFIAREEHFENVFVIDLLSNVVEKITDFRKVGEKPLNNFISNVTWSHDGRNLIFNYWGRGVLTVDIKEKTSYVLLDGERSIGKCALSPDGKYMVYSGAMPGKSAKNSELFLMSMTNKEIRQLTNDKWEDTDPCWAQNNEEICYVSFRHNSPVVGGELYVLNIKNGMINKITSSRKEGKKGPFSGWTTDRNPTWAG